METWKKPLLALFSIEMNYTGRNGSKNLGFSEFSSFKNIRNQLDTFKKPFFRFSQSRWVILGETVQVETWENHGNSEQRHEKSQCFALPSIEMSYTRRNIWNNTKKSTFILDLLYDLSHYLCVWFLICYGLLLFLVLI